MAPWEAVFLMSSAWLEQSGEPSKNYFRAAQQQKKALHRISPCLVCHGVYCLLALMPFRLICHRLRFTWLICGQAAEMCANIADHLGAASCTEVLDARGKGFRLLGTLNQPLRPEFP